MGLLVTGFVAILSTSCSLELGKGPRKSPVIEMALRLPAGYPNRQAAAKNNDGVDHIEREHWRKAAADFRRALEVDPILAVAHFNLALSLDQLEKHAEAERHFKEAIALAPDDTRIYDNEVFKKHLQ